MFAFLPRHLVFFFKRRPQFYGMKFLYEPFFGHYNSVCIANFAEIDTFDNDLHSAYAKIFMLAYCNNVQMQYMHVVFYIFHAIYSFCS